MSTQAQSAQKLIVEVRRLLGAPLGTCLLAGLAADEAVARRAYVVTARFGQQAAERRYVELIGAEPTGLPHGREPLVWASVLRAVFEGPRDGYVAGRHHRQVLKLLGWANSAEGRALVEGALAKYLHLTILEVRAQPRTLAPDEEHYFVTRLHPVVEYQSSGLAAPDGVLDEDASFRLEFSQAFSAGLRAGGLFAAEWVALQEIEPASWEGIAANAGKVLRHILSEPGKS